MEVKPALEVKHSKAKISRLCQTAFYHATSCSQCLIYVVTPFSRQDQFISDNSFQSFLRDVYFLCSALFSQLH